MFSNYNNKIFKTRESTCEEELNLLTYEFECAFMKRRQDSEGEIAILKAALSEYKKKYDSCRLKLKELFKKHEGLKVQLTNKEQNYQEQLAELQQEVTELTKSIHQLWQEKREHSLMDQEFISTSQAAATEKVTQLEAEVQNYAVLVEDLNNEIRSQKEKQQELQALLQNAKKQLANKDTKKEANIARIKETSISLAQKAHERFLREESVYQERFRGSLTAKLQRLHDRMNFS